MKSYQNRHYRCLIITNNSPVNSVSKSRIILIEQKDENTRDLFVKDIVMGKLNVKVDPSEINQSVFCPGCVFAYFMLYFVISC
jgi:hypothetical protein